MLDIDMSEAVVMVPDTRKDKTKAMAMKALKKQSRYEIPRFPVYPFDYLKNQGFIIPYTMSEAEIIKFLDGGLALFDCGMIGLAWKGTKESLNIMREQLKNKDYNRRSSALKYIVYHDLFKKNMKIIWECILDGQEAVVGLALNIIKENNIKGLHKQIMVAMEYWPYDEDIQNLCREILDGQKIDYHKRMVKKGYRDSYKEGDKYSPKEGPKGTEICVVSDEFIYEVASQNIIKERAEDYRYYERYLAIIRKYFTDCSEEDANKIIDEFAKEGCGYASLATTMMKQYFDNADFFKMNFGYWPMYLGKCATDFLMLEFYCMADESDMGMTLEQVIDRFTKFCNFYNVKVDINILNKMDETQFLECQKNGYVIIFAGNFTMHYYETKPSEVKGWHMMNVCGMKEDVMTVVSWGRKHTLSKKDIHKKPYYVYVQYR